MVRHRCNSTRQRLHLCCCPAVLGSLGATASPLLPPPPLQLLLLPPMLPWWLSGVVVVCPDLHSTTMVACAMAMTTVDSAAGRSALFVGRARSFSFVSGFERRISFRGSRHRPDRPHHAAKHQLHPSNAGEYDQHNAATGLLTLRRFQPTTDQHSSRATVTRRQPTDSADLPRPFGPPLPLRSTR